mmetsp:Transcript_32951/g.83147  ORF Transcript_32951/g.83147 Transcript_32951/m.83147 type:complete len:224 (+) Transcript_32951:128-799(+)
MAGWSRQRRRRTRSWGPRRRSRCCPRSRPRRSRAARGARRSHCSRNGGSAGRPRSLHRRRRCRCLCGRQRCRSQATALRSLRWAAGPRRRSCPAARTERGSAAGRRCCRWRSRRRRPRRCHRRSPAPHRTRPPSPARRLGWARPGWRRCSSSPAAACSRHRRRRCWRSPGGWRAARRVVPWATGWGPCRPGSCRWRPRWRRSTPPAPSPSRRCSSRCPWASPV